MMPPLAADMAMMSSSAVRQLDGNALELMRQISCRQLQRDSCCEVWVGEFFSGVWTTRRGDPGLAKARTTGRYPKLAASTSSPAFRSNI
jgi:hypothetical protein